MKCARASGNRSHKGVDCLYEKFAKYRMTADNLIIFTIDTSLIFSRRLKTVWIESCEIRCEVRESWRASSLASPNDTSVYAFTPV